MPAAGIGEKWSAVLKERVAERVGVPSCPLALAMRILLCNKLSIATSIDTSSSDVRSLLKSQSADGGWYGGWLCGYPSTGINIQNVGYTTCFAIAALECSMGSVRRWKQSLVRVEVSRRLEEGLAELTIS